MAGDELRRPLKPRRLVSELRTLRITPLRVASTLAAGLAVFLIGWLLVVDDPLGGEPLVVMEVEPADPSPTASIARSLPLRTEGEDGPAQGEPDAEDSPAVEEAALAAAPAASIGALARGLTEDGPYGLLPKIAADGRTPAKVYARPVSERTLASPDPKIALIIGGVGLSEETSARAVDDLPPEVTLALAPYGKQLQHWADRAHRNGHEVVLQLPMEPFGYPMTDPGPRTLLVASSPRDNRDHLRWHLSRFSGYAGVINYLGGRFTSEEGALRPVFGELEDRGLVLFEEMPHARSQAERVARSIGLGYAGVDLLIDAGMDPAAIDRALGELEAAARSEGLAIASGSALPMTLDRLERWLEQVEDRGFILVPASAAFSPGRS